MAWKHVLASLRKIRMLLAPLSITVFPGAGKLNTLFLRRFKVPMVSGREKGIDNVLG